MAPVKTARIVNSGSVLEAGMNGSNFGAEFCDMGKRSARSLLTEIRPRNARIKRDPIPIRPTPPTLKPTTGCAQRK